VTGQNAGKTAVAIYYARRVLEDLLGGPKGDVLHPYRNTANIRMVIPRPNP
jgi:hypothetical protein